ncbi:MAG: hypothetical protein SGPRY_014001 [Prymnesium sp.]
MSLLDTISGVVGATVCTLFGNPFDVAKARMQAQTSASGYTGLLHCLSSTARAEGLPGLYRGALPALTSAVVENSVGITTQRFLRRQLASAQGKPAASRYSGPTEVGLGAVTGVFTSLAICPFEVIKVRQQVLPESRMACVARDLLQQDGPLGLFRGLASVVCRDVPFNAIFYGAYESVCTLLMRSKGLHSKDDLDPSLIFLAGGLAGSVGW